MNNDRRKTIGRIISDLENLQEEIRYEGEEEQNYADNMPENMQGSEKYDRAEEVAQEIDQISEEFTDLISRLQEVTE